MHGAQLQPFMAVSTLYQRNGQCMGISFVNSSYGCNSLLSTTGIRTFKKHNGISRIKHCDKVKVLKSKKVHLESKSKGRKWRKSSTKEMNRVNALAEIRCFRTVTQTWIFFKRQACQSPKHFAQKVGLSIPVAIVRKLLRKPVTVVASQRQRE
jgi:hypothetical protein